VYALNWLLLPVNIAGVLKSLQQGLTGKKIPFSRTPKVAGRTSAPGWAVASLWLLLAYALLVAARKLIMGEFVPAGFAVSTSLAIGYALVAFVGLRDGWADVRAGCRPALRRLARSRPLTAPKHWLPTPRWSDPRWIPSNPD
jgi:hypothetical protein